MSDIPEYKKPSDRQENEPSPNIVWNVFAIFPGNTTLANDGDTPNNTTSFNDGDTLLPNEGTTPANDGDTPSNDGDTTPLNNAEISKLLGAPPLYPDAIV